jgi:hypothetical protein
MEKHTPIKYFFSPRRHEEHEEKHKLRVFVVNIKSDMQSLSDAYA